METLPERDNDDDSDNEENENIEADDPSLGQVKQDVSKSDSGHGWLVTFIVRRITVSRWGQGLLLWIFLRDPCQTHFHPHHHHTHSHRPPLSDSVSPPTTHTHTHTHMDRPHHSEGDPPHLLLSRSMWLTYQWSSYRQHKNRNRESATLANITMQKEPRRGIFFLPLVSPYHPFCLLWMALMLLFDLTYTVSSNVGECAGQSKIDRRSFHPSHDASTSPCTPDNTVLLNLKMIFITLCFFHL